MEVGKTYKLKKDTKRHVIGDTMICRKVEEEKEKYGNGMVTMKGKNGVFSVLFDEFYNYFE